MVITRIIGKLTVFVILAAALVVSSLLRFVPAKPVCQHVANWRRRYFIYLGMKSITVVNLSKITEEYENNSKIKINGASREIRKK